MKTILIAMMLVLLVVVGRAHAEMDGVVRVLESIPDYGQPGGLVKRVAIWEKNIPPAKRAMVARKTGFYVTILEWLTPAVIAEARENNAIPWLQFGPFAHSDPAKDVYRATAARGAQAFTCAGQAFWFRCGDPRIITDEHSAWLAYFENWCRKHATDAALVMHIDWECYSSEHIYLDMLPAELSAAIVARMRSVSDIIDRHFPNAVQGWNSKWSLGDSPRHGMQHSIFQPRPVSQCPGDVAYQTIQHVVSPHFWELVVDQSPRPEGVPYVAHIALGKSPLPTTARNKQILFGNFTHGDDYDIGFDVALGWFVGGMYTGERFARAREFDWVEIEYGAGDDGELKHFAAFVAGLTGRGMVESRAAAMELAPAPNAE